MIATVNHTKLDLRPSTNERPIGGKRPKASDSIAPVLKNGSEDFRQAFNRMGDIEMFNQGEGE